MSPNSATALAEHGLDLVFHAVEDTQHVGRGSAAGLVECHFVGGHGLRVAGGAIDGTIQLAKTVKSKGHERSDGQGVGDIAGVGQMIRAKFLGKRLECRSIRAASADGPAFGGES